MIALCFLGDHDKNRLNLWLRTENRQPFSYRLPPQFVRGLEHVCLLEVRQQRLDTLRHRFGGRLDD